MCLSDNMENIPHNPQKQFITLNAGESEQLLKVYEIQLKTFNSTIAWSDIFHLYNFSQPISFTHLLTHEVLTVIYISYCNRQETSLSLYLLVPCSTLHRVRDRLLSPKYTKWCVMHNNETECNVPRIEGNWHMLSCVMHTNHTENLKPSGQLPVPGLTLRTSHFVRTVCFTCSVWLLRQTDITCTTYYGLSF